MGYLFYKYCSKSIWTNYGNFITEMHNRFDKVEEKLIGVGGQIEQTNEYRMEEYDFIADKVNKLEKENFYTKK